MIVDELLIRDADDSDSAGLIALIDAVFREYPGCVLDLQDDMPDLLRPASAFSEKGGRLWTVERDGEIVACIGCRFDGPEAELLRLYVGRAARGGGIGTRLVALVEDAARRVDCTRMVLWTDTRFTDAHRLYERLGYVRQEGGRALHDLSNSIEYCYRKALA